jgi:hypothetical protein
LSVDIGSASAGSKLPVAAGGSVVVGGKVGGPVGACTGQPDDTDVFLDALQDCAV